ncbi:MAG: ABC transporter permease [Phycisphaerae bacterium]|nr:MAG: ABC transporter permease [Phycisphaerae bacterium]
MSAVLTIARRELSSYFRSPSGWIIIALFLFLTGMVFGRFVLVPGRAASLRDFFAVSGWLLLPVVPAISMRLLADEIRSGSLESLLTAPVGGAGIVLGKYLGAMLFFIAMLAPTGVYIIILERTSTIPIDLGPVIAGYLCLVLTGGLYLAIGTLASSLTGNATLAFLVTLFIVLGLMLASAAAEFVPPWARQAFHAVSLPDRTSDFAKGVIDSAHVVFFVTVSGWSLIVAAGVTEWRRWR